MNVRMARETESEGRGCGKVLRWALVVACALLLGVLIGFCLLLVFDAAYWIINAIWIAGWSAAGTRFFLYLPARELAFYSLWSCRSTESRYVLQRLGKPLNHLR